MKENLTDPERWGEAINRIGPTYAIILLLLAMMGYSGYLIIHVVADRMVPAMVNLTAAIQAQADREQALEQTTGEAAQAATRAAQSAMENNRIVVENQGKIIEHEEQMITQHQQMLELEESRRRSK